MNFLPPLFVCAFSLSAFAENPRTLPTAHTVRDIEGWKERVDDRRLGGEAASVGDRALKLLAARFVAITVVMPEPALTEMRGIVVQLDLDYGALRNMQCHGDAGWLPKNVYAENLAKGAHIPDAAEFLSPFENHRMPWVVLHELAHASALGLE